MSKVRLDRVSVNFALQLFDHLKNLKSISDPRYAFLRYHQNVVRAFINDTAISSRGLLVFHEMGTGKSWVAAAVAMDQLDADRHPIVLLTKSLQANLRNTIIEFIKLRSANDPAYTIGKMPDSEIRAYVDRKFSFVSMNASNMIQQMVKATETEADREYAKIVARSDELEGKIGTIISSGSLDDKILIVDEAHNLFRSITNGSKNGRQLYDMVMRAKNLKILFLTGTPISNDPFELVPCMNMLAGGSAPLLPENWTDFYKYFVDRAGNKVKNAEKLQNRIMGLVSHISKDTKPGKGIGLTSASTSAKYPEVLPRRIIYAPMEPEQYAIYQLARDKELEEAKRNWRSPKTNALERPKNQASSSYRQQSRQLSNFCPPRRYREGKFGNINVDQLTDDEVDGGKLRALGSLLDEMPGIGYLYSQFVGAGGLATVARYLKKLGWQLSEHQNEETVAAELLADAGDTPAAIDGGVEQDASKQSPVEFMQNLSRDRALSDWLLRAKPIEVSPPTSGGQQQELMPIKHEVECNIYDSLMDELETDAFNITDHIVHGQYTVRTITDADFDEIGRLYRAHAGEELDVDMQKFAESQILTVNKTIVGFILCVVAGNTLGIYSMYADPQCDPDKMAHYTTIMMQRIVAVAQRHECTKIKFRKYSDKIPQWFEACTVASGGSEVRPKMHATERHIRHLTSHNIDKITHETKYSAEQIRSILDKGIGAIIEDGEEVTGYALVEIVGDEAIAVEFYSRSYSDVMMMRDFLSVGLKSRGCKSLLFFVDVRQHCDKDAQFSDRRLTDAGTTTMRKLYYSELDAEPKNGGSDEMQFDMSPIEKSELLGTNSEALVGEFSELSPRDLEWPNILLRTSDGDALGYIKLTIAPKDIIVSMSDTAREILKKSLDTLVKLAELNNRALDIDIDATDVKLRNDLIARRFNVVNNNQHIITMMRGATIGGAKRIRKYAVISGVVKPEVREKILRAVNSDENMHGGDIDLLLISATGAEGLDLKNQRYGIAFEPYWVFSRLKQIDARGARANSHIALPEGEQNFQPILFIATKPKSELDVDYNAVMSKVDANGHWTIPREYYTTDLELFHDSIKNESLILDFYRILESVSIECLINGEEYCRVCAPNNARLYTGNVEQDMQISDQCEPYAERMIKATEIIVDGKKYYYVASDSVFGWTIYEFNDDINSYVKMPEDSTMFESIVEKIELEENTKKK